jgi:hypothetical protein
MLHRSKALQIWSLRFGGNMKKIFLASFVFIMFFTYLAGVIIILSLLLRMI